MKENLLLLHGALGSKHQFDSIRQELENTYTVYTFSFEGHGGRPSDKDYSIQLFSENVIDFLQNKPLEKVKVFGYSMGGYVALNTALYIPDKISKIITLGTKFNWDEASTEKEVKMLDPEKIEEKVPHFAKLLKERHDPLDWKVVMNKTATMMTSMARGKKLSDVAFKNINLPVVIGIGSEDRMVSSEESEYVTNLLPNGKLIKLEGVKHPIEQIEHTKLIDYILSN